MYVPRTLLARPVNCEPQIIFLGPECFQLGLQPSHLALLGARQCRGCRLLMQLRQFTLGMFNLAARLIFALNELRLVHVVSTVYSHRTCASPV